MVTEDRLIKDIDRRGEEEAPEEDEPEEARPPTPSPLPYDPSGSVYTVEEASLLIGVGRSTLYSWIGQWRAQFHSAEDGRTLVTAAEVERLLSTPRRRDVVTAITPAFPSREAANRQVSRLRKKGCSLGDILERYAPPDQPRPARPRLVKPAV